MPSDLISADPETLVQLLGRRRLWRVCRRPHADLSGVGAEFSSGRWHTQRPGARALYCAADPSTAILEVLVRYLRVPAPPDLVLVRIALQGSDVDELAFERPVLGDTWAERVDETRALGDAFLSRAACALLVPSAVSPAPSANAILNPNHEQYATRFAIEQIEPLATKINEALAGWRAAE